MTRKQRLVVDVGDVSHDATVTFDDTGRATVEVAGRIYEVTPRGDHVQIVAPTDDHHVYAVSVEPASSPTAAAVAGVAVPVRVRSPHQAALEALERAAGTASGRIEAPMPGRIVRVLVEEGATVEKDAPCVIIEAMKMENELRAPVAGTVTRLVAEVDTAVDAGALLCEITATVDG
ncbi:MAG: acetyl-CoA carboxylase biotin carboxyl carrier protein subunit [Deltaproteobacteria bacterium]|nr:MAG: acetyl-CoA carboxylase biotin carboxyl carrier protein subunit [Deltaproteobacteria bacterium]